MFPPDLLRHKGKYYGKYSGVVVGNGDPDHRGTLTVRVDSIFPKEELRARPCLPFGHFFIPDKDARIWVEFEAGDARFPIWVGTWYPPDGAPEETRVDPPTHRVIHTPSGHQVELSDEPGDEKVIIRHRKDSFVAIQADGSIIVTNQKGSHLFLDADGKAATLMSEQGHLVSLTTDSLLLVNDGGAMVELKGGTASIIAPNVVLSGTSVAVGANASDPTIMGNAFKTLWQLVVAHVHPSAMGPTGPGTPPILPLVDGVHLTSSVVVK